MDELIREKLFKYLNQELPYVIKIENVSWNELPNGELVVEEAIIVPKESQKVQPSNDLRLVWSVATETKSIGHHCKLFM